MGEKKICNYCAGSGKYITYNWGYQERQTSGHIEPAALSISCKVCNGTGWIDEDEEICVPRKYIKDEYWRN